MLGIKEQTVKNHLSSIYKKLGIGGKRRGKKNKAIMEARNRGWCDLGDFCDPGVGM
jgi:DNA-binding NarL/FixJ family response regulator